MSMFANLGPAPAAEVSPANTPEREPAAKKQDTTPTITAFWGAVNLALAPGQQPSTFAVLLGNTLTRTQQSKLATMTLDPFDQIGQNFVEGFSWRSFNAASKFRGIQWQKGIGVDPPLHLCKGPGAMVKHAATNVKGKEIAQAAADHLGARLDWQESGYESSKTKITMLIIDDKPVFYGNLTYVLQNAFYSKWPDVNFVREQACIASAFHSNMYLDPACLHRPFCQTAIRAGSSRPISSKPLKMLPALP